MFSSNVYWLYFIFKPEKGCDAFEIIFEYDKTTMFTIVLFQVRIIRNLSVIIFIFVG